MSAEPTSVPAQPTSSQASDAQTADSDSTVDPKYMAAPGDSYTKLAMRNMVRRGGTSLFHFGLTTVALLGGLVALAYLFR